MKATSLEVAAPADRRTTRAALPAVAILLFGLPASCSRRPAASKPPDASTTAPEAQTAAPPGAESGETGATSLATADAWTGPDPEPPGAEPDVTDPTDGGPALEAPGAPPTRSLATAAFTGGDVVSVSGPSYVRDLRALPEPDGGAVVAWTEPEADGTDSSGPGRAPPAVVIRVRRLDGDGRPSGEAVERARADARAWISAMTLETGPNGGMVVAWLSGRAPRSWVHTTPVDPWLQRFGPAPAESGPTVQADPRGFVAHAGDDLLPPGVALDAAGRMLVVWDRRDPARGEGSTATTELVAARFDEGGAALGVPERLAELKQLGAIRQLARRPMGGGIVLYSVDGKYFGRRFDDGFAWSGPASPLLEGDAWARLALAADGSFLLVWRTAVAREEDPRVRGRLWVRAYDAELRAVGEPRLLEAALDFATAESLVDRPADPRVFFPSLDVVALPGGGYVVGWIASFATAREQSPSRSLGIWAQPCLPDGSPGGARWAVVEGSRRWQVYRQLSLAAGRDGRVFVVWQQGEQAEPPPIAVRVFRPAVVEPDAPASPLSRGAAP